MKGKILFVAGLGLGYIFGTRAGREKYEQLKTLALTGDNPAPALAIAALLGLLGIALVRTGARVNRRVAS